MPVGDGAAAAVSAIGVAVDMAAANNNAVSCARDRRLRTGPGAVGCVVARERRIAAGEGADRGRDGLAAPAADAAGSTGLAAAAEAGEATVDVELGAAAVVVGV